MSQGFFLGSFSMHVTLLSAKLIASFIDHVLDSNLTVDDFYKHEYIEKGDFFTGTYTLDNTENLNNKIR